MKKEIFMIGLSFSFLITGTNAQNDSSIVTPDELNNMMAAIKADSNLSCMISWFGDPVTLYENYKINLMRADSIWDHDQQTIKKFNDIGTTKQFELIPLVDWFTSDTGFFGESGVSYLIRTDEATLLFDLGLNEKDEHPSPLLKNMNRLGINFDDIDIIVISHNHDDHVGGSKWAETNTFSCTNFQPAMKQIPVYTPVEMNYPGLKTMYTPLPAKISKGVATIGVIHNPVFFTDIEEQALAINVENKGVVVISGCGHQSIRKILQRTNILFDAPIYGILGGFHLPVDEGRNINWMYKYIVADKLPWERLTVADVETICELLKSRDVQLVGLSGHDSCDTSISIFKQNFPDSFADIKVGEMISIDECRR